MEHPFSRYIKILGKGKNGSRSLSQEEAKESMQMILRGEVLAEQLGAFLMLLRLKEETPEEITGFVNAVRSDISAPKDIQVDIDWSTYAGKKRQLPWFLLVAFVLSEQGYRIYMHGAKGHTDGRIYSQDVLEYFGFKPSYNWEEVSDSLDELNIAYMPISSLSPVLDQIVNLRNILGLRSPVNTLCRLINPLEANITVDGVFHPSYAPIHQKTSQLLGTANNISIRGDGGEAECKPDSHTEIHWIAQGTLEVSTWPRLIDRRLVKPDQLSLDTLMAVWRGEVQDAYGEGAVVSTLASILKLIEGDAASTQDEMVDRAKIMWNGRNKRRFCS